MRGPLSLCAGLLGAAALTACGGSRPPVPVSGATVFERSCSACHSLIGNESRHRQGGDLRGYRIPRSELLEFTREMPVKHRLSAAELSAVVDYVASAQRRH